MNERDIASARARATFEGNWRDGEPWALDGELDRTSRARQLALVGDRRYRRVLEVGCAAGAFTADLAAIADETIAIDIAPSAIEQARQRQLDDRGVRFVAADIVEFDVRAGGPWDLIVLSETIYCIGWAHSFFDVGWLAAQLFAAQPARGRLVMANTYGHEHDHVLQPWLIDTYRDLFVHVGYAVEHEQLLHGHKGGADFEILISLFAKDVAEHR